MKTQRALFEIQYFFGEKFYKIVIFVDLYNQENPNHALATSFEYNIAGELSFNIPGKRMCIVPEDIKSNAGFKVDDCNGNFLGVYE